MTLQQRLELIFQNIAADIKSLTQGKPNSTEVFDAQGNFIKAKLPTSDFDASDFDNVGTVDAPIFKIKPSRISELINAHLASFPNGNTNDPTFSLRANRTFQVSGGTVVTQLATPTLTIGAPTANTVPLSWAAIPNAENYILDFSLDNATNWTNAYTGPLTNHNHINRAAGTQYFYRLKAIAAGYTDSAYATGNATTSAGASTYTLEETLKIDFGNNFTASAGPGWNEFAPTSSQVVTASGYTLSNLKNILDEVGVVSIGIGAPFGGATTYAAAVGSTSIYPDNRINTGLGSVDATVDSSLIISGLDDTKFYHFFILPATNTVGTEARFDIGGVIKTKLTTDNYPLTSGGNKYVNTAIVPYLNQQSTGGVITLKARKNVAQPYAQGVMNILEIERSNIAKI